MRTNIILQFIIVGILFCLIACSRIKETTTLESIIQTPTQQPTNPVMTATLPPTPVQPTNAPEPTPTLNAVPSATQAPACVTLFYEDNAQVEVINSEGTRVLIDVFEPALLSRPANANDILLTTHTHFDHINESFLQSFPGKQLFVESGEISVPGLAILGIPSAHNNEDGLRPSGGTNYIFVIETDGFRIAHFGDIGQNKLTQEQLQQLGEIDIAITQFANPYSNMDVTNQKEFRIMEQLSPKLIIPTHINLDAARLAIQQWEGRSTSQVFTLFCQPFSIEKTSIFFMGANAEKYAKQLGIKENNE